MFIDDYFKAHPQRAHWRQSNNAAPDFTDAEVMTIALMQGYFGGATLRRTYALVKGYWGASEELLPPPGTRTARF